MTLSLVVDGAGLETEMEAVRPPVPALDPVEAEEVFDADEGTLAAGGDCVEGADGWRGAVVVVEAEVVVEAGGARAGAREVVVEDPRSASIDSSSAIFAAFDGPEDAGAEDAAAGAAETGGAL